MAKPLLPQRPSAEAKCDLQANYTERACPERPHSQLAKVRQKVSIYQKRLVRYQNYVAKVQDWLAQQEHRLADWETETPVLSQRMQRFEAENAANPGPMQAILRLDAGFGIYRCICTKLTLASSG